MNKKIIISILIFFLLISIIPLNNVVQAYIMDVTTGFEDGVISYQYSNSWLTTQNTSNQSMRFCVDNVVPYQGTKEFKVSPNGIRTYNVERTIGWWNYTYSGVQFIHLWESYVSYTMGIGMYLYMYFNNSQGQTVIKLVFATTGDFSFVDYDAHLNSVHVFDVVGAYKRFGFIMTANDSVNYYYDDGLVTDTPCHILDDCNITTVAFRVYGASATQTDKFYFDAHNIVISDTISGGGITYPTMPSCSGSQIGQLISTSDSVIMPLGYTYLTYVYKIVSTFNISDFYTIMENVNPLASYQQTQLKINNYDLGYPNNIDNRGATLILSWENMSGIQIKGEMVYICFKYPFLMPQSYDRHTFDKTISDIDYDGFTYLTVHADTDYWDNFCNFNNYRELSINRYGGKSPITEYYDLDYSFCYEYPQTIEIQQYQNDLWVIPLSVDVPEKVTIGYTLSNYGFLQNNFIRINKSGIDYYNESIDISMQGGSFDYRVLEQGVYNVSLFQNHIKIKTVQFTANGVLDNTYPWIYTDLATVKAGQQFKIYYNYPFGNFQGAILYYKCSEGNTLISTIEKNATGLISYSITTEGLYMISLNVNPSTNSYSQLNSTTILVINPHTNKITLSDSVIQIPKTITIYGEHGYTGSLVYIYKNGLFFQYIGCQPLFSFYDYLIKSEKVTYSIVLDVNGVLKTLDSTSIMCSGLPCSP